MKQFSVAVYRTWSCYGTPRAHPQFHFQLAALRKVVMKAVAKEHSDVIESCKPKL